jgi:hypothetical protein
MNIVEILKEDYQRFPSDQTFCIYASNVYFKDPLNQFRGVKRYQEMIGFLSKFFQDIHMELHEIKQTEEAIDTEWTLSMTAPLPWKPRLTIPGGSELKLDRNQLIISHIDYWHISRFDVLKQALGISRK